MREIIFRGKRLNNGEWIEGSLCTTIPSDENFYTISYFDFEGYYIEEKVIPSTIGQYTGLTDKTGKKIFEGDIVWLKNDEEPYQVAFDECCFQVYSHGVCYVMDNFYDHDIEVIGNVFDNPGILK